MLQLIPAGGRESLYMFSLALSRRNVTSPPSNFTTHSENSLYLFPTKIADSTALHCSSDDLYNRIHDLIWIWWIHRVNL